MSIQIVGAELKKIDPEIPAYKADILVAQVMQAIKQVLVSGRDVMIHDFGNFRLERHPNGRVCADNLHGKVTRLPPHVKIRLKTSPTLEKAVSEAYCKLLASIGDGAD